MRCDLGPSHSTFRATRISRSFPNPASGCAGFWRCSSRLRTSQKSFMSGIRLRSARRNLDRHFRPAGRISGRRDRVLMLSGGEALENYALRNASSVCGLCQTDAVHRPSETRRRHHDVPLDDVAVGDTLVIYPHDISPGGWNCDRRPRRHERSVPDRRTLRDYQSAWLHRHLWRHQWRIRSDYHGHRAVRSIRATPKSWRSCASPNKTDRIYDGSEIN